MFGRGSPDQLPRRARKAIEETDDALKLVKSRATKSDLAVSDGVFSLQTAIEGTESLLSIAKCHDMDSAEKVERIAPFWILMASCLRQRDEVVRRVGTKIERRHSNDADARMPLESIQARATLFVLDDLKKALGKLRAELGPR